ncbi:hypothetical protein EBS02_00140 [bacterium]|nr:hypothetical protein [bacterium]
MAISLVSPGIKITEKDLVSTLPSVGATVGGFSGQFRWGPIEEATLVTSEVALADQFGKPNATNIVDFLSAANFLSYSSALRVVRVANTALNATASNTTADSANAGTGVLIKNLETYNNTSSFDNGPWAARYAGALGNSLKVSTCPSSAAWQSTLSGTFTVAAGSTAVVGSGSAANTELSVGDLFIAGGRTIKVAAITNATHFTLASSHLTGVTAGSTATRRWEYYGEFTAAPGTSTDGTTKGATNDEMHVVVVDEDGLITGVAGQVLEKYDGLSKGSDAKGEQGGSNYYKDVINASSRYVYWTDHDVAGVNWGNALTGTTYTAVTTPKKYSLAGGSDGNSLTDGNRITGYGYFANKDLVPVNIMIAGQATATVVNTIISDICELRKDCIVCASPLRANAVNNAGSEVTSITTWAGTVTRSSYAVADSGWKYQYDKYNDVYVYVPLNADTAGCIARNDNNREPWLSPAGIANGVINNVIKLSWNPKQEDRDALYKLAVNPVFTQTGRGTILFGDKTFILKNSSFSRVNVRKLFIELERTIGASAESVLFEQNDATTRATFVNLITPYLRSVQARRGITNFRVICDGTNNPEDVVLANEFVCDIFVQPITSVNFIQLNFVSVRGSASFTEVTA